MDIPFDFPSLSRIFPQLNGEKEKWDMQEKSSNCGDDERNFNRAGTGTCPYKTKNLFLSRILNTLCRGRASPYSPWTPEIC